LDRLGLGALMDNQAGLPLDAPGFTLIEVLFAIAIVTTAALMLAGVLGQGVQLMLASQAQMIATEKATEAVESVFTARDTRVLAWAQIRNMHGASGADGGVFVDGLQPLRSAGPDGLVNTADDGPIEELVLPGADNLLGTADDQRVPLIGFEREIAIRDLGPNLRQVTVTVRYRVGTGTREQVLVTYISSYA
jgi:prepilin-type N-terminal cleavage/methylation domain-containing protein